MFFYLASLKNQPIAVKNLALIEHEMTDKEIQLAREYADTWMEQFP